MKETYSELNAAQQIIYTPSMIGRAFSDFEFGDISGIYRVGSKCVVLRNDGYEWSYPAGDIREAYTKFIGREVPFFDYLGPNYRGPIPWTHKPNTFVLLKGWHYSSKDSYKKPEAQMQRSWIDSFNNLTDLNSLKAIVENFNDDDPDEAVIPDTKEALGHVITPDKYCSCQAFQKQLNNLDEFREEFSKDYQPTCKHLVWYKLFRNFQKKRIDLTNSLPGGEQRKVAVWFYTPMTNGSTSPNGTFQLWWTRDGLYSKDPNSWTKYKSLTQYDAWEYLFKMIDKGFIPYEGSLHPKVQAIHEKSITGCSNSSC